MKKIFILLSTTILFLCIILFYNENNTYHTVEKLTKKGNTIAFMLEQDDGTYKSTEELPTSGYEFNPERSQCNNGATPTWDKETKSLRLSITKKNTSCFLYFDKELSKKKLDELGLTLSETGCPVVDSKGVAKVTNIEGTNNLICSSLDDDGETYYFRGAVDNNWVKFAGKLWRIIRINGDGTIRLIYGGDNSNSIGSKSNGKNALDSKQFNAQYNDNSYVGLTNNGTSPTTSYDTAHTGSNPSTILNELNSWYLTNLKQYEDKIDTDAGFCSDRTISSTNEKWYSSEDNSRENRGFGTKVTAYGAFNRFVQINGSWKTDGTKLEPTLKCENKSRDLYTKAGSKQGNGKLTNPIGLITADEVVLAGGYPGQQNTGYWLRTGEYYWTMSPWGMYTSSTAYVFAVNDNGDLGWNSVRSTYGVRPVINLKADTKFTTINDSEHKQGTIDNPYIVGGAE